MYLRTVILIIASWLFAGCAALLPAMVGGGGTAAYYYHSEKSQEVCRVPMEKAYTVAVRTMTCLGLEITEIEEGRHRHIIYANDPTADSRQVIIDLEGIGGGEYVKATFRATDHQFLPDRAYSQMLMKEFINGLHEDHDKVKRPPHLITGRR